jgi:ribosomal protein S8
MALESTVTMRGSAAVALNYAVRAMTADAGMVASANPRGWAPVELPAPKSNVGSIVATTMAEVVAFDVNQAAQLEGQVAAQVAAAGQEFDIDQILERRRRVG